MAGKEVRAGGAFVEFSLRRKNLERQLRQVAQRIRQFGGQIRQIGASLSAAGGIITAPFAASIAVFAKVGDSLDKMRQRTGFSAAALTEFGFAAEQTGSDLATFEKAVRTMQRSIIDLGRGLSTQQFAFEQLGIVFKDLEGLNPERQFTLIADRISKIEDPTKRVAVAMQILGRSGQQLLPLLSAGAAEIAKYRKQAERLGITIDDRAVKSAAAFTDAINILKLQVKAAAVNIGAALGPALTRVAGILSTVGRSVIDWARDNATLIQSVAAVGVGVITLGGALIALGTAVGLAVFALKSLIVLFSAVLSPIGLLIVGIVAAGVALVKFTDLGGRAAQFLKDSFGALLDITKDTFAGIKNAITAGDIELAVDILWNSIELITFKATERIQKIVANTKADILTSMSGISTAIERVANASIGGWRILWSEIKNGSKQALAAIEGDTEAGQAAAASRLSGLVNIVSETASLDAVIQDIHKKEMDAIAEGRAADQARIRDRIKGLKNQQQLLLEQAETERKIAAGWKLWDDFFTKNKAVKFDSAFDVEPFDPGGFSSDFSVDGLAGLGEQIKSAARSAAGITSSFNIRALSNGNDNKKLEVTAEQIKKKLNDIDAHISTGVNGGLAIT